MSDTWYSTRGFAQKGSHKGTYPASGIRVYESSAAEGPHLWIEAKDDHDQATVHLSLEDAEAFARDILDLVENHYQVKPR